MNKNDFIDNALKEHARLEGNDDQGFLDQLEAELDHQEEYGNGVEKENSGGWKFLWPAIAATVVVSVVSMPLLIQEDESPSLVGEELSHRSSKTTKEDDEFSSEYVRLKLDDAVGEGKKSADPLKGYSYEARLASLEESGVVKNRGSSPGDPVELSSLYSDLDETTSSITPAPLARKPMATAAPPAADLYFERDVDRGYGVRGGKAKGLDEGRGRGLNMATDFRSKGFLLDREATSEKYGALVETGFLSPLSAPLSTFSIDVDTAAYTNIRRHIINGQAINPDAVRIEEMINYFDYQYAQPEGAHPFAVHTEVASCPWNPKHRLVRIGLQGEKVDEGERKAANLVFLLDVSGSMNSPDKLPLLVQSFQILLKQLNENDRVSLVVYAGRQAVLLQPTSIDEDGRTQVAQALRQLSAGGSTAGAAGIKTAYELARKGFVNGGVNRVILATDGDFNVGTTNHDALLKLVKQQADGDISLTVLGFGQGNLNDAMMEKLTNSGDGNYFYIDSLREGQKVFQQGLTGTIQTIAKDVKIQVEFNPGKVGQYRLIGYANRRLKDEDFKNDKVDAGDIGAGHRVTALYEVVPAGVMVKDDLEFQKIKRENNREIVDSPKMLQVKLRYKQPDGDVSTKLEYPLIDQGGSWEESSEDFRFSSGVALWGMLLRNSSYSGGGTVALVSELALGGQGDDVKGERAEMLDLVRRWSSRR